MTEITLNTSQSYRCKISRNFIMKKLEHICHLAIVKEQVQCIHNTGFQKLSKAEHSLPLQYQKCDEMCHFISSLGVIVLVRQCHSPMISTRTFPVFEMMKSVSVSDKYLSLFNAGNKFNNRMAITTYSKVLNNTKRKTCRCI